MTKKHCPFNLGRNIYSNVIRRKLNIKPSRKSKRTNNNRSRKGKYRTCIYFSYYEKIEQEDGIYVGNVRLGGINPFSFSYETYNEYYSNISQKDENISSFLEKCYSKTAIKSDYENAIDDAETAGISTEWIDYAYNNQGDIIRNIQPSSYNIELRTQNGQCYNIFIPLYANIKSNEKNFDFSLNLHINYVVSQVDDAETLGGIHYDNVTMNPESISFWYYNEENQEIQDEVQLPFGMVLKQDKKSNDLVIEWQGQTFNEDQLRTYIINNTKIVYNGQTVNLTRSTSGEELDNLFGIKAEDLYNKGYIDELANQ